MAILSLAVGEHEHRRNQLGEKNHNPISVSRAVLSREFSPADAESFWSSSSVGSTHHFCYSIFVVSGFGITSLFRLMSCEEDVGFRVEASAQNTMGQTNVFKLYTTKEYQSQ